MKTTANLFISIIAFESCKENIIIYMNHYKNQQEINYFFYIFDQSARNEYFIIDRLNLLHNYAKSPGDNCKRGLEKGMKFLVAWLFENDIETRNVILLNNEAQKINEILTRLSWFFKVKFIVLESNQIKEYMSTADNVPIVFLNYIQKESSVL